MINPLAKKIWVKKIENKSMCKEISVAKKEKRIHSIVHRWLNLKKRIIKGILIRKW